MTFPAAYDVHRVRLNVFYVACHVRLKAFYVESAWVWETVKNFKHDAGTTSPRKD
jgi:hypothetical protein